MAFDGISPGPAPLSIQFKADHTLPSNGKNGNVAVKKSQDNVEFSHKSQEFLQIRNLVDSLPDFRLERVNQLAKTVNEGTYDVTSVQIADAIIRKNLIDFEK
jgi:flagellar biosynthesis anti-sigma factor FlgM